MYVCTYACISVICTLCHVVHKYYCVQESQAVVWVRGQVAVIQVMLKGHRGYTTAMPRFGMFWDPSNR